MSKLLKLLCISILSTLLIIGIAIPVSADEDIVRADAAVETTEIVFVTQTEMDLINMELFGTDFKRIKRDRYDYPKRTTISYGSYNGSSIYSMAAGMAASLLTFGNPIPDLLGFSAAVYQRVSYGTDLYYTITRTQSRVDGVTRLKAKIDVYRNADYSVWVYGTTLTREYTIND
ncbi:hypothetical protein [Erysipelothrix anatis]|uniref:hypothetical protein n=1 Tax=Erysipelothrix anatis TaxID=2683713 RepID=UPI00135CD610|nr:hypothetical protein [Erysipelothrix anatis]